MKELEKIISQEQLDIMYLIENEYTLKDKIYNVLFSSNQYIGLRKAILRPFKCKYNTTTLKFIRAQKLVNDWFSNIKKKQGASFKLIDKHGLIVCGISNINLFKNINNVICLRLEVFFDFNDKQPTNLFFEYRFPADTLKNFRIPKTYEQYKEYWKMINL